MTGDARLETLYGGRTNRVWKVLGGDGDKVLKLYRTTRPNPLFRNDAALEAECLKALEPTGFVPRLQAAGRHLDDDWVLYDHAPGTPWQQDPEPVAELLCRLHAFSPPAAAPTGCNGSIDLERKGQSILDLCTSEIRQRLAGLCPKGSVPPSAQTCLIHGDPVAGNILVAVSGLTLIDWQCPARGDPCEDLALFLSPAMQHLYRGQALTVAEEDRFLTAYGQRGTILRYRALRPWYAWRMAAYCLWQVENGSADYAKGLELELAAL